MAPSNPAILPGTQSDPLAALRDIHLPVPVSDWPPAPGWWVLAFLVIFLTLYFLYRLRERWQANRYRREALRQLESLYREWQETGDEKQFLSDYQRLLKRAALTRYPRVDVASLTGEAWVDFLDRSSGSTEFSMGQGQTLVDGNYAPDRDIDVPALNTLGEFWIRHHKDLPDPEAAT